MSDIKIIKGVKMPERPIRTKYPFGNMDVGDMFTLPKGHIGTTTSERGIVPRVLSAARYFGTRSGKKFTTRGNGDGSISVWRVK